MDHPFIDGIFPFSGTLITAREYSVTIGDWNMNEDNGADGDFKLVRKLRNVITHERFSADPGLLFYVLIELDSMNASVSFACPASRWMSVKCARSAVRAYELVAAWCPIQRRLFASWR